MRTPSLNEVVQSIHNFGVVFLVFLVVSLNSLAAFLIALGFGILEFHRVEAGAVALGQSVSDARLLAVVLVAFNALHPIYRLRAIQAEGKFFVRRFTLRSWLSSLLYRVFGKASTQEADLWRNPVLDLVAWLATITTVVIAVYDLLAPLLDQLFTGVYLEPVPVLVIKLCMGLGLSIVGVYALQAAAHECGVIMYRKLSELGVSFSGSSVSAPVLSSDFDFSEVVGGSMRSRSVRDLIAVSDTGDRSPVGKSTNGHGHNGA